MAPGNQVETPRSRQAKRRGCCMPHGVVPAAARATYCLVIFPLKLEREVVLAQTSKIQKCGTHEISWPRDHPSETQPQPRSRFCPALLRKYRTFRSPPHHLAWRSLWLSDQRNCPSIRKTPKARSHIGTIANIKRVRSHSHGSRRDCSLVAVDFLDSSRQFEVALRQAANAMR